MRSRLLLLPALSVLALAGAVAFHAHSAADKKPDAKKPTLTFKKEGVAFLQKHCVACHGEKKKAGVSFTKFKDDAALLKNRKLWKAVQQVVRDGEMPPPDRKVRPTLAENNTFLHVVRGVFEIADKNAKPDPGRITIRRLNKAEYNNTIRDLVGVDFNPAEDFPSDDIGHGFDNIGDVLTLSPVLMERYLSAAESIVTRAIVVTPPKSPQRHVGSRWLEPATQKAYKWRPLDTKGKFHSLFNLTMDGEYTFRVRAYGESADDEPIKIALTIDGKEIKRFEVKATKQKPAIFEVKTTLSKGGRQGAVELLNASIDANKKRTLQVEWLALIGPADTRPASHKKLLATTSKTKAEQTRDVLTRFATRAFRRPATKDEIDRLIKLAEKTEKLGDKWEAGIQLAMQAVLISPKFLFRLELDDRPQDANPRAIDEQHLASRLSYFLWSSMPDDELTKLAGQKKLKTSLDAQVKRMLKDARSYALVENFAMQWLQLRRLKTVSPDPKLFPTFNEQLRSAMFKETELFFHEIVREDRSILDLIDGKFTYINDRLSWHYGIIDTHGSTRGQRSKKPGAKRIQGPKFVRVELDANDQRGGILTHASILTVTSNPTRTSPVKRGRWVLEQLLGTPPPPPPPDVEELKEDEKAILSGSFRKRMELHRAKPACAACHAKMDPIGFAFENYDAVGKYRWKDGKFNIDPSGTLPDGKSFKGPAELKKILRDKKDLFARCLTEKMLTYALGRGLEYYDKPAVDAIVKKLASNDYKFSVLVTEIAKSFPFTMRRGKELKK